MRYRHYGYAINLEFVVAVTISQITSTNLKARVPAIEWKRREDKSSTVDS